MASDFCAALTWTVHHRNKKRIVQTINKNQLHNHKQSSPSVLKVVGVFRGWRSLENPAPNKIHSDRYEHTCRFVFYFGELFSVLAFITGTLIIGCFYC